MWQEYKNLTTDVQLYPALITLYFHKQFTNKFVLFTLLWLLPQRNILPFQIQSRPIPNFRITQPEF